MKAASSHNHSQFYALLQDGADVNVHDQQGMTPLMAASFAENVEIVKALLDHGARVNDQDIDGRTALHYAAEKRLATDAVPTLLKAKADVNLKSGPTAKYLPGATPLIIAASAGNERAVEFLLNAGADPNARTTSGLTALDVARQPPLGRRPGHAKIIEMLELRLAQ
jgi:ankyrin repeat protein